MTSHSVATNRRRHFLFQSLHQESFCIKSQYWQPSIDIFLFTLLTQWFALFPVITWKFSLFTVISGSHCIYIITERVTIFTVIIQRFPYIHDHQTKDALNSQLSCDEHCRFTDIIRSHISIVKSVKFLLYVKSLYLQTSLKGLITIVISWRHFI